MSLILLIIIAVVVIVIIKKNRKAKEESAPVVMNENANQINFFTESKEDMAEQKSQCQAFINSNEELTKVYNQIYDTFIPKKDGNYKGALSGLLDVSTRAKRLAKAHETVKELCNGDGAKYNAFFTTLYNCILNDMYSSNLSKLSNSAKYVLEDFANCNKAVQEFGFDTALIEFIATPTSEKREIKVDTDSLFKKIKFTAKRKNGVVTYEIVNLYRCARQGYNLTDPLVRAAEVLIAICDWYEYATGDNYLGVSKESIEKYDIPNKSWSEKKMFE